MSSVCVCGWWRFLDRTCEDSARICARVRMICATTRPTCDSCAGSARRAFSDASVADDDEEDDEEDDEDEDVNIAEAPDAADADAE